MADENRAVKKPIPEITPVNQPFWDGAKAGKLMIQKCQDCGTWVFCPRPVCGECASDKLDWVEVSGKGKIFSFTVIREVVGQVLRGFAPDIPYVTAWIDLDGGAALLQQHHRLPDRQGPYRYAGASRFRRQRPGCDIAEVQASMLRPLYRSQIRRMGDRTTFSFKRKTGRGYLAVIKPIPATSSTTPISTNGLIFSSPRKNSAMKAMAKSGVVLISGATTEI